MEPADKNSFQLLKNNFHNINSEFTSHTTLKTTAHLAAPNFAKISVTRDTVDTKIVAVKTSKSIMQVFYKNSEFQTHRKLNINDETLERQIITTVDFNRHVFNPEDPPYLIVGYQSGLLSYIDCTDGKLVGLFNCDEKRRSIYKNRSVSLVAVLPYLGEPEIIAMFEDSTAMRYRLNTQTQNMLFVEKISKFEAKISFNKALNKFKHKTKNKNSFTFGSYLNDAKHEFNHFYAISKDSTMNNPAAYYKFNHRTISDFTVKRHQSFSRTILKNHYKEDMAVMAMTSLDGYLVLYELTKMKPLLSYKGEFGGINAVSFSENCELIALSGQDDCITILDLYTLTTIKCMGHKSFVSRAIFQSLPLPILSQQSSEEDNTNNVLVAKDKDKKKKKQREPSPRKGHKEERNYMWMRMVSGGMDAVISFWEFNTEMFGNTQAKIEENKLPLKLSPDNTKEIGVITPMHLEQVPDAVGWIEMCDNMLVQCGYDGAVSTYLAKDIPVEIKDKGEEDKDKESMTTKATEKEKEERSPIKHDTKDEEEEENKEIKYRIEDIILTRHESNTDFRFEQQEYTDDDETVSKSMLYFEGMGGRTNRKTPSWSFTTSKLNSSTINRSVDAKEKS